MTPDPAFIDFFAGPFQRALQAVSIPGMADASWDRKAAYLLWKATDGGTVFVSPSEPSKMTTDKSPVGDIFS